MEEDYEFILFNDKDEMEIVSVKTRFADNDAWLTLEQIAMIYQVTQEEALMHISNIYEDGELDREKTCKKYLVTLQDGGHEIQREMDHYNLDMINALGYRVRAPFFTYHFRRLAKMKLDFYIQKGYIFNYDDDTNEEEEIDWAGTKQWAIKVLEKGGLKVIDSSPQSDIVSKKEGEFYSSLPWIMCKFLRNEY